MRKRILSLLMALVLICSCCFTATTAHADDTVDSTLTLDAGSCTAKKIVFAGTDSIDISSNVKKFKATDADEGIFINSVKDDSRAFVKKDGNWIINLASNVAADTIVTAKGTFTYDTTSVRFATITVKYNGSAWEVIDNPAEGATQVTLTGTDGWSTCVDGDHWVLYLTTSGYSSADWSKKYAGLTYEIDGVTGTTSQVSSCENNRLYCTIPTSSVPAADGTTFTIKAGTYAAEAGTDEALNIATDFQVTASESRLIHTTVIEAEAVEAFNHSAASFYFSLKDASGNAITTGYETWDNFLSPSWCDGTRITQDTVANQWSTVYSGVFIDGQPMDYWGAHFKNTDPGVFYIDGLNAVAGTTVVVKGYFASSRQSDWGIVGNYFLRELEFVYDGSVWNYVEKVETTDVTLTGMDGWSTCVDGDHWVLYMTTSGYSSTDWTKKYAGFTYEIDGVTGTTSQVSSAENNKLYCTIPTSSVPIADGTTFTIKAGTYAAEEGTSEPLNIVEDFQIVASESRLVHATVIKPATVEAFNGNANSFYFSLKDASGSAITTGYESWDNFLSPAWCDGTRITQDTVANQWSTVYSGVFVDGNPIDYWGAHFKNTDPGIFYIDGLSATNGTKVTIKGYFAASKTSDWTIVGNYFLQELEFTYDGSVWSYVDDAEGDLPDDEPTITEHTGTPTYFMGNTNAPIAGFYFVAGETTFPYDTTWGTNVVAEDTEDSGVFLNGEKTSIVLKKTDPEIWYVCISDAGVTPSVNDIITIKGAFAVENDRITFTEAKFVWDGSKYKAYVEYQNHTGTPVFESSQADGFYFTAGETAFPYDAANWTVVAVAEDDNSGIFFSQDGGSTYNKLNVNLQKVGEDRWFAYMAGDTNVTLKAGDIALLKGAFIYENHRITFSETKFIWDGTVWGEEVEVDEDNIVFTLDRNMASGGNVDGIYLIATDSVPYDLGWSTNTISCVGTDNGVFLNGVKTDVFMKKYETDKYYVCLVDASVVPQDGDTVTIKGAFKTEDYVSSYKEYTVTFKNGRWLDASDMEQVPVKENNVKLTLDKETFGWMAGTEAGIYLFTDDNFAVDANWRTPIYAVAYDENSGIFFNGKKVPAYLKKHADGMIYLDISAADIFAKDGDKVTIKGTFALDGYGVSYAEQTFYYNGQSWGTTYTEPIVKTTTTLNPIGIVKPSSFNPERKAWDVYVQVDNAIPGGHDYEYKTFVYEVNGETYETSVYRVDDKLVFFVPETIVPLDAKDGTAITLKAGTASDNYGIYDIKLAKDCTAYVYRKAISGIKPTENTPYLDITIPGLLRTWTFNKDLKHWQLFFIVEEEFDVEDGTEYYDMPVKLNGKSYEEIHVYRSGECLYISIPESVLPSNAKSASLTIGKGAKAVANAGWNGIRLNNEVKAYMFDGVWNNIEFKEAEETDLTIKHMNFCNYNSDISRWDIYVNVDKKIPGTHWFEYYDGLTAYLNGKKYTTYANKAESENERLLYISLSEDVFGKFKDGDILYIPGDVTWSCGGYKINNTRDFYLQYVNGTWFEYYESDVKAPEAMDSLWEKFRIDGYIPVQEEKGIMFTSVAPTNVIKSTEEMKDVTFTFETTKMMAMNEELPTNSFILRGQPLNEQMGISETALYGYNISFSYIELTEANMPNNPELWGTHSQEIAVWKNGINYNLLDQYRMTYNWQKTNHPFFEYDVTYKYTVSIYNVAEDICVIEVYCNDKLIMSVVDHASDDPMDPARNAGEFQIYASCPQYFNATPVELDTLAVSASECYIGKQVRVSATYPAILEGAEYTVDGEGATIKDGVFSATKPGTYTVKGTYNGKDKGTVQIKVSEEPKKDVVVEDTSTFPIIPVAIGGGLLLAAAIVLLIFLKKRNKKDN